MPGRVWIPEAEGGSKSMQKSYLDRARDENMTVRQLAAAATTDFMTPMGVEALVDHVAEHPGAWAPVTLSGKSRSRG